MNKPILTVVVPVYNVEKYLEQCLNSLVNQTVINHKVIAVDDGSKDSSGKIADSFAEKYPDIVSVIHKQNAGLGAARNTVLKLQIHRISHFLTVTIGLCSTLLRLLQNVFKAKKKSLISLLLCL